MPSNKGAEALRHRIRGEVPEAPGVYTWLDAAGATLYAGKSLNLRRRMLSYLAPSATRRDSRIRNLAHSIEGFTWQSAPGELAALLLEDALIKQLEPRFNERQRDFRERRYLLLTADRYPALLVVENCGPRSGELFGPYKDQHFVAALVEMLCRWFRLRSCHDAEPHRMSARFDLGQCAGPCRGAISAEEYGEAVAQAREFLGGNSAALEAVLATRMEEAAAALRFETAAAIREELAFVRRFCERQRFLGRFREGSCEFREPGLGLAYRFEYAALVSLQDASGAELAVPPALRETPSDARFALDRANVAWEWTRRRRDTRSPREGRAVAP